jgi:hypothetical protein
MASVLWDTLYNMLHTMFLRCYGRPQFQNSIYLNIPPVKAHDFIQVIAINYIINILQLMKLISITFYYCML